MKYISTLIYMHNFFFNFKRLSSDAKVLVLTSIFESSQDLVQNPNQPFIFVKHIVKLMGVLLILALPQHLMFVSLMEDHSLVVVERPLLDIMSQLPAPVRQKKFAT